MSNSFGIDFTKAREDDMDVVTVKLSQHNLVLLLSAARQAYENAAIENRGWDTVSAGNTMLAQEITQIITELKNS